MFEGIHSTVPFCDVILADVLTSFAKVLGDVWISISLLFDKNARHSWSGRFGVPMFTA